MVEVKMISRRALLLAVSMALTACMHPTPVAAPRPSSVATLAYLPALKGDYFALASRATGRTYHIYVRLPEGYDPSDTARRYPVVYLLDGDSLFPIIAANHLFLTLDDKLPEAVIVGIAYGGFNPSVNKRGIDSMPPGGGIATADAGAPAFARFMRTELLPRIEAHYRVDPARRILFGQSRGGSFVLYSAFVEPDLFWGRIASNPSFVPGRELFFGSPAHGTRPDLSLIVASGTANASKGRADALAWFAAWQNRKDEPWVVRPVTIEGGTHAANSADAYRAGLRLLFGADTLGRQ